MDDKEMHEQLGIDDFGLDVINQYTKSGSQFAPYRKHPFERFENCRFSLNEKYRPKVGEKVLYCFGSETGVFTVKELEKIYCLIGNRKAVNYRYVAPYTKQNLLHAIQVYLGQYSLCILGKSMLYPNKESYWDSRHFSLHRYRKIVETLVKHYRKCKK